MEKNKKTKTVKPDRMPIGKFFAWKSRDISLAAITVIISGYLMLYCSNTLGMSTAVVGTLLMASKLFDGVTDLFAGYIVDNTHTKLGKARPYEICIILVWVSTIALFFADPKWSMTLKCIWVFVMYTFVFSIFTTLLNGCMVPYMVRAFSGNRNVITKVSSFGGIVTMAGSMIVSLLFPQMMAKLVTSPTGGSNGWKTLILIFAIPLMFIGILRFVFVKEDPSIDAGESTTRINLKEIFTMMKKNKYAWSFAGINGIYQMVLGFGVGSYYFTYIVGDISAFGLVSIFGIVLLPLLVTFPKLINKFGIAKLFIISAILSMVGYITIFFAKDSLAMIYVGVIVTTLISLPSSYLQALCIMDLSTYNESMGLRRMEGTTGIINGFAMKVLNGIGTGVTGILLGLSGFISSTGSNTVIQPGSALIMIRLLYSLIPALCMLLIVLCAIHFGKLEKKMPEIEEELKAKKEETMEKVVNQ